jgi:hypothetical protein
MSEYVVELYLSREEADALGPTSERIRLAADELSREGTAVRYLRWIFVPQDETCLLLYEADSAEAVGEAARRAGVAFERITEAVESSEGRDDRPEAALDR